ncbi:polysaccharide deacetylase family protein [bacterium]|nr:polysaccharide deacetylase family protein [bacterium]
MTTFRSCLLACAAMQLCLTLPARVLAAGADTFRWPGTARAAVCFTYDDGIDQQIDIAARDLENAGMRGTFFVPGSSGSLARRLDDWRALAARGHELGNHTLFHPCIGQRPDGSRYDWVLPEYDMGAYSLRRMLDEIRVSNTLLQAVDGRTRRTYAAPCNDTEAGGVSYLDSLAQMFVSCRIGSGIPEDMQSMDTFIGPVVSATNKDLKQLIEMAETAAAKGTVAAFCFHGVGGGHATNTPREVHQGLIDYLNAHRDRFWVATYIDMIDHVNAERKRLGWN